MGRQGLSFQSVVQLASVLLAVIAGQLSPLAAQALYEHRLGNGSEFIHLAQPLSEATTVSWLEGDEEHPATVRSVLSGRLTLIADVEAALAAGEGSSAPGLVVAVGGAAATELRDLLDRVLAERLPRPVARPQPQPVTEGGLERRLGPPGGEAVLRLAVSLPPPQDPRRPSIEVLWELLPSLLGRDLPGLLSRVDSERGILEARVDAQLAEVWLGRVRLALARLAAEPRLDGEAVERARRRLKVRRQATLEQHPAAAALLLELWRAGGSEAVRQFLFGLEGVDLEAVQRAASEWLGQHPGSAVLVLPPHVLSPRFAPGPQLVHLANDLTVAVLERPGTPMAAVCLRPVLVPDVDGEVSATVLARVAAELRAVDGAPGWIRVAERPTSLELAGPSDAFDELCEVLVVALQAIADDERPIPLAVGGPRRRAMQLLGGRLGLGVDRAPAPAELLRPGNLALGAVVADAESAVEALHKILAGWSVPSRAAEGSSTAPGQRTREAVPGELSVVALSLPLAEDHGWALTEVVAELLLRRAAASLSEARCEVFQPFIPGRRAIVLVVSQTEKLDTLEGTLSRRWGRLVARAGEAELDLARRQVAARLSAVSSGALGRARSCAGVAVGAWPWRSPTELELEVLTTQAEAVDEVLQSLAEMAGVDAVGAGALPIGGDH